MFVGVTSATMSTICVTTTSPAESDTVKLRPGLSCTSAFSTTVGVVPVPMTAFSDAGLLDTTVNTSPAGIGSVTASELCFMIWMVTTSSFGSSKLGIGYGPFFVGRGCLARVTWIRSKAILTGALRYAVSIWISEASAAILALIVPLFAWIWVSRALRALISARIVLFLDINVAMSASTVVMRGSS